MQTNFIESIPFENEEIIVYEENNAIFIENYNIFDTLTDEDKHFIENLIKEICLSN